MNMYLNYFRENERYPDENNPVGIILCADKNEEAVRYSLGQIDQKIFVSRYKTCLPTEESLLKEVQRGRRLYEDRRAPEWEESSGREGLLQRMMEKKDSLTISEYMKEAGISRATAHRDLAWAVRQGWLEKHGRARSTHYRATGKDRPEPGSPGT